MLHNPFGLTNLAVNRVAKEWHLTSPSANFSAESNVEICLYLGIVALN